MAGEYINEQTDEVNGSDVTLQVVFVSQTLKRMLVDDDTQTKMDVNETTENFTQRSHFDGSNTHHRIYKLHKTVNKTTGCLWNFRPSSKS